MRLLSYNIHKGIGGRDRRYDFDRVVRVIEHENPDVICLQEVTKGARRTHHDDQPGILQAKFPGAGHLFQMTLHYREGGYGNLILSRWPVAESHHICLRRGRWKPRGVQLALVETPDGRIQIANWHLGLGERERHWQVDKLMHNPLFRRAIHHPTVIVGDFNDWRNKLAAAALLDHGFEEATKPTSRFRSFPAFFPVVALDKAFHKNGIKVVEARVVRTPLAHRASDHLPLVVDFHLDSTPAPRPSH